MKCPKFQLEFWPGCKFPVPISPGSGQLPVLRWRDREAAQEGAEQGQLEPVPER